MVVPLVTGETWLRVPPTVKIEYLAKINKIINKEMLELRGGEEEARGRGRWRREGGEGERRGSEGEGRERERE